ncbi:polynucleotide 5'-hydroxyl-kinase NOL9-like isoform X2 [Dendronephthya gigantea]|uniref:polynucleotide 5'-hydroxyl-kinase NOL9-like isoform X2 n=1 Tax=Dendronephthya gigantea TaxID=151771 RepID=UPI001069FF38|nr:polynucleotide 5'-hydroxyl-kinase NOL9-like isoform X2 [Dendronephthya gigantea]
MSLGEPSSNSLLRLPSNDIADCVLLLGKCKQTVYILGRVDLRKVSGVLSIHGHDLKDSEWHSACSSGGKLITLECNARRHVEYSSELISEIVDVKTRKAIKVKLKLAKNDIGCIVFLKANMLPFKLGWENLFQFGSISDNEDLTSDQEEIQSKTADLSFTLFFKLPNAFSPLLVSPSWRSISKLILSNKTDSNAPVVLICGGKNVGKSTFGRYLVNKLLNTRKYLYFLETDVGQSEFTAPGVLSLTKVDKPIFGPPFVHLAKPERAFFFGDISPKDHPSTYVQLIYFLYKYYVEYCRETPLIVNTCGWVKGMGVRILLDIIRIVQPSHVVQINFDSQPAKNFPVLNKEFLSSVKGWSYLCPDESDSWACNPYIQQMDAFKEDLETSGSGLKPSDLRSLSLLSYFIPQTSITSVTTSVQEYILRHSNVYSRSLDGLTILSVYDDICPDELLHSINGSVVGLVRTDVNVTESTEVSDDNFLFNKMQFGQYLGLGIVRNIDVEKQIVYIITPEPIEVLNKVQVLVKGSLEILDCLYKKQDTYGKRPYVTSEFSYSHRGSGQKRIRYNLLRQKSPHSPSANSPKT